MNKIENPNKPDWSELLKRPTQTVENIEDTVNQIFNDVTTKMVTSHPKVYRNV